MSSVAESFSGGQLYCPSCEKSFNGGDVCPDDNTRLVRLKVNDPLLGRVLDGRYTILEKLGQGGMGAVYRGSQHSVGREVAIKLVTPTLVSDSDVIKRFLREAKLASRLSHPNAVGVLDFGQTEDGLFYLVMELVTGRTLDQVIKAERTLSPERIVRIGSQVCDALEGAHTLQIVHRDLKPANIMLMASGRDLVKVLDFGLAKSLAPDQTSTTMTNAGSLLGTPAFIPPELALGESCDGRADLYSLGVVLYLMGAGRLPFVSESAHELIAMHGSQAAPPMTGVPQALATVVDRMLQKNPARRYQTAAENREALEAAIDHRLYTPVSGVSRVGSSQLPRGGRSDTEIERLASSDTLLGSAAAPTPLPIARAKRKSWLAPVLALAVLGAAAGAFFVLRGSQGSEAKPAAAREPNVTAPPPAVVTAPEQPPAAQTPPAQPPPAQPPPAQTPPAQPPPEVKAPPADTSSTVAKTPKTQAPPRTPKTPKVPKQTSTKTTTATPPPADTGSAAKPSGKLPF